MPAGSTRDPVIAFADVHVEFSKKPFMQRRKTIKAVDGVTLEIGSGETLGLVGESGSGKTTLGRAAIGLTKVTSGQIVLHNEGRGIVVSAAKGREWKRLRKSLQIIFQDPFSSIDPNMKVYDALRIPLQSLGVKDKKEIGGRIERIFKEVGLSDSILGNYVFQLSGGQRQRVGIARVLLFDPLFVVADEPVSMLDVSLKGEILNIIKTIANDLGVAFLFITHEMAVARAVSDRIAVMYLGEIDELGTSDAIVNNPLHPYTKALLEATPNIDTNQRQIIKKINIKGEIAQGTAHPSGCKFHPRCPFAMDVCSKQVPHLKEVEQGHWVSCWLY
ncbi:MAG: oligopeptide/dipeptide ABC transporter ATP-binding protein [Nitrososphaerales archaeon]